MDNKIIKLLIRMGKKEKSCKQYVHANSLKKLY